ncbi:MAG TPA: hypothetical protein VJ788_08295 [Gemmatimonadota bacterium]|nr:hypothetical protein [Gemmatimonadota bacterium]
MGPEGDRSMEREVEIPLMQRLYDRPFLLLILGVSVVGVFYTLWGLIEILRIPQATLP